MNSPQSNNNLIPSSRQSQHETLSQIEVLSLIKEEKYEEAINNLIQPCSLNVNDYQTSNNWNIFLIKILTEIKSLKALSPSLLQSISSFFTNTMIGSFPVIMLNEIIFYFTIGQHVTMMNKYKKHIIKSSYDYILFVNSTVILIEACLLMNLNSMAEQFIMFLEHYLDYNNTSSSTTNGSDTRQGLKTIHGITMSYNNDQTNAYYNSNEIYHKDTNMNKEILLLLKCYMHLNQFQCDKAKKNLNDFKSIYSLSHFKKSVPLYVRLKRMYNILKIKLDYLNNAQFKCYKHLDYLSTNYTDKEACLFKYNSYGIWNLKIKKVKYAEYYFLEALTIAKCNRRLLIKYWHCIIFNLALCSFYSMEYDKCYNRLISIKDNETMKNNVFYYYRLGLCLIEREFKGKKNQISKNNIAKYFIRHSFLYSQTERGCVSEGNDSNGKSRFYDTNNGKNDHTKCHTNRGIVLNQKTEKKQYPMIVEGIGYFKQCVILLKGYNSYIDEGNEIYKDLIKELKGEQIRINIIMTNRNNKNKVKDKYKNNENINSLNNSIKLSSSPSSPSNESETQKSYSKIFSSSISHLLFCLLLTDNYSEVIYYGNKYINDITLQKEQHLISNYIAEAYIHLGQARNALNVLVNNSAYSNDNIGSVYSINNDCLYSDANYQVALRLNVIKIHFLQKNISEVEKGIAQIMQIIGQNELPPYIANVLLYYYFVTKKNKEAIDLISYRNISNQFKP